MKTQLVKLALFAFLGLMSFTTFAQEGTIKGKVIDAKTKEALVGASIAQPGTSNGTITDGKGNFSLQLKEGTQSIQISFIGYNPMKKQVNVKAGQTIDLGTIAIKPTSVAMDELVVIGKGVIDLQEDRITPIAASTITIKQIQDKGVGNVEFPDVMKNTPSVYVSNQAGGFGDSQMFVRGFDQRNTAFLLNGQPINGMEDGRMYWSDWAGLADVANAVQVQRGLGSSKLAISSVGGTVNIVTKATDLQKGGFVRAMTGNNGYMKGTVSYNTGINDKGWGFSMLLDYWRADAQWAHGTRGEGQNIFLSVGKIAGKHKFNFLLFTAPQWHDQNFTKSQALYDQYGIKYNNNYGYLNGKYLTSRRNYYNKPVFNFNWDWDINANSNLSTVLYASIGTGGGTGTIGSSLSYVPNSTDSNGLIDWNAVESYNSGIAGGISSGYDGTALRASVNNHFWYGMVTNYQYDTQNHFTFNVGADIRFYKGDHFRELVNLLGLNGREADMTYSNAVVSKTFNANPWASLFNYAGNKDRIDYNYSEQINYQGLFGQAEYANNGFSAFVQAAASNQSYQREDKTNFTYFKKSDVINKFGYDIKGGASYTIAKEHKIYVNTGTYSRQPFLDNIFPSYADYTEQASPKVDNEKIFGLEAGYSFSIPTFTAEINGYYTTWKNRFFDTSGQDATGTNYRTMFTNIAENHKGIEIDTKYKPVAAFMVKGYMSIGDWKYNGTTPYRTVNTDNNTVIEEGKVDLTGTKIGQAPQFSAGLSSSYDIILNKLSVDADFNHYGKFYGYVDEKQAVLSPGNYQPEKLNNYSLFDLGATYRFVFNDNNNRNLVVRGNIYNLFNKEFISQQDKYGIMYGAGTTWNLSLKYNF